MEKGWATVWDVILWALALGTFVVAMVLSYRETLARETPPMTSVPR